MSAQVGDKVGVKKEGKKILFYFNGSHQASMRDYDVTDDVYGFVDLFGSTRQVSIMSAGGSPGASTKTLKDSSVSFKVPDTQTELLTGLHHTMRLLKDHDPDKIQHTKKAIEAFFYRIILQMSREADKLHTAEYVAGIDDSAQIITNYLRFLWQTGVMSGGETAVCYLMLFDSCLFFTSRSLSLCQQLLEAKLVHTTLNALKRHTNNCVRSSVRACIINLHFALAVTITRSLHVL